MQLLRTRRKTPLGVKGRRTPLGMAMLACKRRPMYRLHHPQSAPNGQTVHYTSDRRTGGPNCGSDEKYTFELSRGKLQTRKDIKWYVAPTFCYVTCADRIQHREIQPCKHRIT